MMHVRYATDIRCQRRGGEPGPPRLLFAILLAVLLFSPSLAAASIANSIYRVDIRPKQQYTRITVRLADAPEYRLESIPGNRLRLVLKDTGGTLFKKFRRYSDRNIGGLVFSRRDDDLLVTFQVAAKAGWRDLSRPGISAVTLDVGVPFKPPAPHPYIPGREKIWSGIEKLVRDFDPPLKSEIPFTPTDRQILKNILDESDQKLFMAAEAALYKGNYNEAEEAFTQFAGRQSAVKALALYRLGETWYKVQKYPQALSAFREAEKLWPAYLSYNPGVTFCYGDSIARSGDLSSARPVLAGLVARLADRKFAPALLVRLGDILVRQGHDREGQAIFSTVAENFRDNKANLMAQLRLADHEFLQATPWNYRPLRDMYHNVSLQGGDFDLREEATFKYLLLESIHGDAAEALQQVMAFQRRFPKGVYVAVTRTIREVLVADVFRQTAWDKDFPGLVRFVEEQQDYLADCIGVPGFLDLVTRAYRESARPIELVKLLGSLVDRQWAGSVAPDMYLEIADNAELIGDTASAERALKAFLRKFPKNPRARQMLERLGALYFSSDRHQQVRDTLLWLLNKGEKATQAESYYNLGKSLWSLQQYAQAARSMELFLAAPMGRNPRLVPDAYYVAASAKEATGDRKGALRLFEGSLNLPDNKRNDEFVYRTGEINLRSGNTARARVLFEHLVKNGKDPDWQRLAEQALASLDARGSGR